VLKGGRTSSNGSAPPPEPFASEADDVGEEELARGLRMLARHAQDGVMDGSIKAGPQQSEAYLIVRVADVTVKAIDNP